MNHTVEPWTQTYTGIKFWLNNPTFDTIDIEDIAHALSMQCRYAGHSKFFYSVAEHSFLVSNILPDKLKLAGLLHDAAETYLGDITKPLKQMMGGKYSHLEINIQKAIYYKFDLLIGPEQFLEIKIADLMILRLEAEQVLNSPPIEDWHINLPEYKGENKIIIDGMDQHSTKHIFLESFHKLTNNRYA